MWIDPAAETIEAVAEPAPASAKEAEYADGASSRQGFPRFLAAVL
jgi:hypothetical protein